MSTSKKKLGLLIGMMWYWFAWQILTPHLISYLFETPNLMSEFLAELITLGMPALLLSMLHFKVDDTKTALFKIDDEPINDLPPGMLFAGIISCVGLFFFVTYAINTVQLIYAFQTGRFVVSSLPDDYKFGILILVFLINAVLPAVFEEIIYRGLYYDAFRQSKKWTIYLVSTFIFASLHSGVVSILNAFLLGLMLIVLYDKFLSLKLTIVIHFVYNLLGIVFGNCIVMPFSILDIWTRHPNNTQLLIAIAVSICITLLTLLIAVYSFILCLSKEKLHRKNAKIALPPKKKSDILLTIWLIVFAFLTLALNFFMSLFA